MSHTVSTNFPSWALQNKQYVIQQCGHVEEETEDQLIITLCMIIKKHKVRTATFFFFYDLPGLPKLLIG